MKTMNVKPERRCLSLCLALILALSWPLAVAAQDTAQAGSPFSGGEGVISGQVINGSTGDAPSEEIVVQLRAFDMMGATLVDAITTTMAADGSFIFEGLDPSAPVQIEPLVVYQGLPYYGDLDAAITLSPEQPDFNVTITVYEPTRDDSAIRIERLHIIFEFFLGQVQVVEIYILSNDGLQPYVGGPEGGTLRLTVPDDALTAQPEGEPGRYVELSDGFADTAPIPPGAGVFESVLMYELAYEDSLELSRPLPYDASQVIILVPNVGVEVSGAGIEPGGPFQMQGRDMQVYLANGLAKGERLNLSLSGAPQASSSDAPAMPSSRPTTKDEPDETRDAIIALVILAASLALAFLYWQGNLRLRPQSSQALQAQGLALYQALADLDDDFEADLIEPNQYQSQRAILKQKLVKLLEDEN